MIPMILTLIGMSGSGKTHWSKRLRETGFQHICCDDLIEECLAPELKKQGFQGLNDVAKWMGQPYEERFQRCQQKYLAFEIQVTRYIIAQIESSSLSNAVIDTTGSVIYIGNEICEKLAALTTIIYLETPQHVQDQMFQSYIVDPKPVIWGDLFNQKPDETPHEALARCYHQLLEYRSTLYQKYAHCSIPYDFHKNPQTTLAGLLQFINPSLISKPFD